MLITAKFPSTCPACSKPIAAGSRVSWTKGQRALHAACSSEGAPVVAAVAASRATDADIDVPAPEGLTYMPFQRAGISYASTRQGVLIADEPGLGKTIQTAGIINTDAAIVDVLVIAPKSLTINWTRELSRWLVRPMAITRDMTTYEGGALVLSYDEAKKYEATLVSRAWSLVVVDEAHYCKSRKAQRTKTVKAVIERAKRRVLLTGTPIVNRPIELWSLLQMTDPQTWDPAGRVKGKEVEAGRGAGFFRFAKRYCNAHEGRYGWDFSGASNLPELREKLRASCMVRRLKKDVLTELPAKVRQVVELSTNGSTSIVQRESAAWSAREVAIEDARVAVELARAEDDATYEDAVAKLRAVTGVAFSEMSQLRHATAVAKIPYVIDHLTTVCEDDVDHKVVIMAHHHDVIDGLVEGLAAYGAVKLTGETSLEDRQAAVDRFQTDPSCRIFVGSITAAGVGITLTAASHVVFAELDWTPGNITQAEDRCHRIGQTSSVLVQHLVFDSSIDARMAHVLVAKQKIADAGLDVEPIVTPSREQPATSGKRAELQAVAEKLTAADIEKIHNGLRSLAGMCDGARAEDQAGFSKIDVSIGHSLAAAPRLSARQAALGLRLCRKYHRQIGTLVLEGVQS